jgi:hypothetical protein
MRNPREVTVNFSYRTALLASALSFVTLLPAADGGCGDDDVSIGDDAEGGGGSGGTGTGQGEQLTQLDELSDCGESMGEEGYCDAELLLWSYDAEEEQLSLEDQRMELNCCGERAWTIEKEGETYVATEVDAPEVIEGQETRCDCVCVFDFHLAASPVPTGIIDLEVRRHVTDAAEGPVTLFHGPIDLGAGSGQVVITEEPAVFCGEE